MVRTIFVQPNRLRAAWQRGAVAVELEGHFPRAAALLRAATEDILASWVRCCRSKIRDEALPRPAALCSADWWESPDACAADNLLSLA